MMQVDMESRLQPVFCTLTLLADRLKPGLHTAMHRLVYR
jgi:hypothetical protein